MEDIGPSCGEEAVLPIGDGKLLTQRTGVTWCKLDVLPDALPPPPEPEPLVDGCKGPGAVLA